MKWPSELYLIRHGQSERNVRKEAAKVQGKLLGHLPVWCDGTRDQDTPLTEEGHRQAFAVGKELAHRHYGFNKIHALIVSPYYRTKQTADDIQCKLPYAVKRVTEERIREIEFGILDGLTKEGIQEKYPDEIIRRQKEGKYWFRPPGGESRPDVRLRCHSILDTLVRDYSMQRVVMICHSVVVLALRSLLERWGEEEYMLADRSDDVLNCGITRYAYNEVPNGSGVKMKLMLQEYNTVVY